MAPANFCFPSSQKGLRCQNTNSSLIVTPIFSAPFPHSDFLSPLFIYTILVFSMGPWAVRRFLSGAAHNQEQKPGGQAGRLHLCEAANELQAFRGGRLDHSGSLAFLKISIPEDQGCLWIRRLYCQIDYLYKRRYASSLVLSQFKSSGRTKHASAGVVINGTSLKIEIRDSEGARRSVLPLGPTACRRCFSPDLATVWFLFNLIFKNLFCFSK